MTLYLVEHVPRDDDGDAPGSPTDLVGLARYSIDARHGARWISTFSPDLRDDRHFSIWEAETAVEIEGVMERFGFLAESTIKVFGIRQWGPEDVIAEHEFD